MAQCTVSLADLLKIPAPLLALSSPVCFLTLGGPSNSAPSTPRASTAEDATQQGGGDDTVHCRIPRLFLGLRHSQLALAPMHRLSRLVTTIDAFVLRTTMRVTLLFDFPGRAVQVAP